VQQLASTDALLGAIRRMISDKNLVCRQLAAFAADLGALGAYAQLGIRMEI
jgi:hypothetical protein